MDVHWCSKVAPFSYIIACLVAAGGCALPEYLTNIKKRWLYSSLWHNNMEKQGLGCKMLKLSFKTKMPLVIRLLVNLNSRWQRLSFSLILWWSCEMYRMMLSVLLELGQASPHFHSYLRPFCIGEIDSLQLLRIKRTRGRLCYLQTEPGCFSMFHVFMLS